MSTAENKYGYSRDMYPLVSIVIPTYNRPTLFKEALDSVLAQDYPNIDIFITDNSHNDLTKKLMEPYLAEYPNIKYEHHPDFDADANWVRAKEYDNPEAEFVNWLMDDDLFMPNKISVMVEAFRANPDVTLVTSNRTLIDIEGNTIFSDEQDTAGNVIPFAGVVKDDMKISGKEAGKRIIMESANWAGVNFIGEPTTALVRKSAMLNNTLGYKSNYDKYFISDYPTWLRVLSFGNLMYLKEPLSKFRIHPGQSQRQLNIQIQLFFMMAKAIKYAHDDGYYLESWNETRITYAEFVKWALQMADLFNEDNDYVKEKNIARRITMAFVDALFNDGKLDLPMEIFEKAKA